MYIYIIYMFKCQSMFRTYSGVHHFVKIPHGYCHFPNAQLQALWIHRYPDWQQSICGSEETICNCRFYADLWAIEQLPVVELERMRSTQFFLLWNLWIYTLWLQYLGIFWSKPQVPCMTWILLNPRQRSVCILHVFWLHHQGGSICPARFFLRSQGARVQRHNSRLQAILGLVLGSRPAALTMP